jgi:glycosyltransferase involved in cell wall biosynthesis
MPSPPRKLRVLHVMHQLTRGGIETWFLGVAQHIDRDRYQLDVLVHTDERGAYDAQIRALGCGVYPCLKPSRPWAYARNFLRIAREHGPYDVVHTHCHHWNGYVLWLAWKAGIGVRIAHSRASAAIAEKPGLARRIYAWAMDRLIRRFATHRFAVSNEAGLALFGPGNPGGGAEWEIVRSGIDLAAFEAPAVPTDAPAGFSLPRAGPVIASIARFDPLKNHRMVIAVFEAIARRMPDVELALIGGGPDKRVREWADASPFRSRIHFLGDRADVPALLYHVVDLVLLPSLFEGLPRVAVEAQAAGVPVLMSSNITREAIVVRPAIVHSRGLSESPDAWAERAIAILDSTQAVSPAQALEQMKKSDFNIVTNTRRLEDHYDRCVSRE